MIVEEICNETAVLAEAQMVWARKGNNIVKKYRCVGGNRHGRIVASPAQCAAPIDIKKRITFKRTKSKLGNRMKRKAKRTKRTNPASRRLKRLNKR